MENKKKHNFPQTVERALDILEVFKNVNQPQGISEISKKIGLNKSTTYRIIQALKLRGYIKQDEQTNKYSLGSKILKIANSLLNQIEIRGVSRNYLEKLSKKTLQTVQLAILDKNQVLYVDQVEGGDPFQLALSIGNRGPLHSTSAGKCFLAFLHDDEANKILSNYKLIPSTKKTITSIDELRKDLNRIREVGFSLCNGEFDENQLSIAAPITRIGKGVVGTVVLTAPFGRIKPREIPYYARLVTETGRKISREMGG